MSHGCASPPRLRPPGRHNTHNWISSKYVLIHLAATLAIRFPFVFMSASSLHTPRSTANFWNVTRNRLKYVFLKAEKGEREGVRHAGWCGAVRCGR